jgi:hypothetical protein
MAKQKGALSVEDWEHIAAQSKNLYGQVKLRLPGYEVIYQTKHESATKGYVMTYINGTMNFCWIGEEKPSPEQQFMRRRERAYIPAQRRNLIVKKLGKRRAKDIFPDLNEKHVGFDPCWPTWRSVLSHIRKLALAYPNLELVRER